MIQGLSLGLWTEILTDIYEHPRTNITEVYKRTGCTYAHVLNIVKLLAEKKLLYTYTEGSSTIIILTVKGESTAANIQYIKKNIGGNKNG